MNPVATNSTQELLRRDTDKYAEPEYTPLQVNTCTQFTARRSQLAAVRQFRDTGVSVQAPTAPNLQAILDYCFGSRQDFTLHWSGKTGTWTVYHEVKIAKSRVRWTAEGQTPEGEDPALLTAQLGIFRASLSRSADGWRLQIGGCGEVWDLQSLDLRNAQEEAAWVLQQQIGQVLGIIGKPA